MTPIRLTITGATVDALVGRNRTPLADVDPGLRARIDQAVTAQAGPFPVDAILTDAGRLIPAR